MSLLKLDNVTLVAMTSIEVKAHERALKISSEKIEFADIKLIYDPKIKNIEDWNRAIIYELPKHIQTSHCLLIHHDGYIINPEVWNPSWLDLDYIGAPWPLPNDSYSYRTPQNRLVRVGNSVSLRSKKLMDLVATRPMEYHYGNNNEDGQICVWERDWLESKGCVFAPLSVAVHFSKEHEILENKNIKTFAFHQV